MTTTKNDAPAVLEKETAPWEGTHKAEISNVAGPSVAPTEPTEGGADPIVDAGAPGVLETDGFLMFRASDGGVFRLDAHGVTHEKDGRTTDICGPLRVDAEARTATGEGRRLLCVSFVDSDGVTHEKKFDRSALLSRSNAIAAELFEAGLEIRYPLSAQGGRPWIANYLKDYLKEKKEKVKAVLGVESYGWIKLGETFALPGRMIGGSERVEFVGDPSVLSYKCRGTLEDWDRGVAVFGPHSSRIAFSLCVGVAPTLMPFFPWVDSVGFHFYGLSSKGKSTTARAVCSVWQCATETCIWKNSDNGLEATAAAYSYFPMVLDEISQVEPEMMAQVIYMLMNGRGKGRMTRNMTLRTPLTWKTMIVSAGELTTSEHAAKAYRNSQLQTGALIRLVNIPACPVSESLGVFESLPEGMTNEQATEILNQTTFENAYGVAGPAFVERLIDLIRREGKDQVCQRIKTLQEALVSEYSSKSDASEVRRVAKAFAFVAAAGELAIELGVFPWKRGTASKQAGACFKAWRFNFRTASEQQEDAIAGVDDIVETLVDRFDYVDGSGTTLRTAARSRVGCIVQGASGRTVYFIPKAFKEEVCKKLGKPKSEVLAALHAAGRLRFNTPRELVFKPKRGAKIDGKVDLTRAFIVTPPPEKA